MRSHHPAHPSKQQEQLQYFQNRQSTISQVPAVEISNSSVLFGVFLLLPLVAAAAATRRGEETFLLQHRNRWRLQLLLFLLFLFLRARLM